LRQLINAAKKMNIDYEKEENRVIANKILDIPESQFFVSAPDTLKSMSEQIASLWNDGGIQQTFEFRSSFNLLDSAAYFLSQVETLAKPGYKPTESDIVRSRQKTVGIVEVSFVIEGSTFMLYDVGGQRNERKKWIHAFDDVTAVIFVASLSEYDQKTIEDEKQNRMIESLLLFDESINCRFLKNTPTILFLNKLDIFQDKVKKSNLNICFSDYKGGYNEKAALDFIKDRFKEMNQNKDREIYIHTTQATDKENVRVVFDAVKNIVLRKHLKEYNLL
jgi:guanine nucleotide-binding protein G(i) subunit alpha